MKLTSFAAVAVTSLLATATAIAQPGPDQTPDAEPAPQAPQPQQQPAPYYGPPMTYAWSNVSHINGTLVPVGEHNQYVLAQKKTNISVNPLGWMFGFYGISGSYAVSNNVAIRADVNFFDFDNQQGYEYGLSAPIYFKRTYSGPFLEPGIIARGFQTKMDTSYNCIDCGGYDSDDESFVGPEVLFGWHSTFDSGLNVSAAIGAARNLNTQDNDDVQPAGYFRVGYAF